MKNSSARSTIVNALLILAVALMYFIWARAGLVLAYKNTNATPVWPPSGIAFAALLLLGYRVWPGITLGAFAANVVVFLANKACDLPTALWVSACIGIGNTSEALLGYYLMKKFINSSDVFEKVRRVFLFVSIALLMCLASCTIGPTFICLAKIVPWSEYGIVWFTWWLGDAAGVLMVTPLLLTWAKSSFHIRSNWKNAPETIALFIVVFLVSNMIFGRWFSQSFPFARAYALLPVLLWAALRFQLREVITVIAFSSLLAVVGTVNGHGPFASESLNVSLVSLQGFVSTITITGLVLAASLHERRESQNTLQHERDNLERRVEERTADLIASQKKYETLLNAQSDLGDGVAITEGVKFVYMNDALCNLYGYTREELLALPSMMDIIVPEERERLIERMRDRLSGKKLEGENATRVIRRDGTIIHIEYVAKLIQVDERPHIFSIIRDITERKRKEEIVRKLETRYYLLTEAAPDAIITIDETSEIILANPATEKIFGYTPRELLGQDLTILMPEYFRALHRKGFKNYLETGTRHINWASTQLSGLHKKGYEFPVELSLAEYSENGHRLFIGIVRDITERKQAEETIRRAKDELELRVEERTRELKKLLDEKSVLLKEIHHRVKNNLQVISSLLHMQEETVSDDFARQLILESESRIKTMALIHESLYRSEDLATIDFYTYAKKICDFVLRTYALGHQPIEIKIDSENITLDVNLATTLGLILNELVTNAVKYAFPNNKQGEISISLNQKENNFILKFSDNGIGIPAEVDWSNTKTLGLQLVHTLVQQLHGNLTMERNNGTRFVISFPPPREAGRKMISSK